MKKYTEKKATNTECDSAVAVAGASIIIGCLGSRFRCDAILAVCGCARASSQLYFTLTTAIVP